MSSIDDYPIPAYAAYIWSNGHEIKLGLPGPHRESGTATFTIHQSAIKELLTWDDLPEGGRKSLAGVAFLLETLQARNMTAVEKHTIGTPSSPNWWNAKERIKELTAKWQPAKKKETFTLADLDL